MSHELKKVLYDVVDKSEYLQVKLCTIYLSLRGDGVCVHVHVCVCVDSGDKRIDNIRKVRG